ncbi:MAG: molybdenum cofactor biosynthesis protein MoaE [Candidatus Omnitrophota bacterium]
MAFFISKKPLEKMKLHDALRSPKAGAFVSFEGRVRKYSKNHRVKVLEYKTIGLQTKTEGQKICREAKEKFDIIKIRCYQRVGRLKIGEKIVWIGVLAAHRQEAFKSCRYALEQMKKRLPIMKKEYYA